MTQDLPGLYDRAYYERDIPENWFRHVGLLRPDQLAALCYTVGWPFAGNERYRPRDPGRVMSIGCGRGDLEAQLEQMGIEVVGVDASPAVQELYRGSWLQPTFDGVEQCRTVLFVESLEHLPAATIENLWPRFARGTRVVVVNWRAFHPIPVDRTGWDHITRVDDALYDRLSDGWDVRVRDGSHLVIDKP